MNGHRTVMAARKAGWKPRFVTFDLDVPDQGPFSGTPAGWFFQDGLQRTKHFHFDEPENALRLKLQAQIELSLTEPWKSYDLRFVIGCAVHIMGRFWTDQLIDFGEWMVKQKAIFVSVAAVNDNENNLLIFEDGEWHAF